MQIAALLHITVPIDKHCHQHSTGPKERDLGTQAEGESEEH